MEWLQSIIAFVEKEFKDFESGHDYLHALRVLNNTKKLATDYPIADLKTIYSAALTHDLIDHKFVADKTRIMIKLEELFNSLKFSNSTIQKIFFINENMSFSKKYTGEKSIEFQIVQDADSLDGIGAIGIARTFSFGGFKGRPFYNIKHNKAEIPVEDPNGNLDTVSHFYEKLFLLKDLMNTKKGKEIAEQRTQFMKIYIDQLKQEIG